MSLVETGSGRGVHQLLRVLAILPTVFSEVEHQSVVAGGRHQEAEQEGQPERPSLTLLVVGTLGLVYVLLQLTLGQELEGIHSYLLL